MNENWKVVFKTDFGPKAELVKSILDENGIENITLNQQDSSYLSFGEIKILVRNEHVILAKNLLENLSD